MAENPPDQSDDLLAAIERLANPATPLPNGKSLAPVSSSLPKRQCRGCKH
jgi:hypothetical protein